MTCMCCLTFSPLLHCFWHCTCVRAASTYIHTYSAAPAPVVVMASYLSGRRTRRHSARVERRACHAMASCRVRCKDDDDDRRRTRNVDLVMYGQNAPTYLTGELTSLVQFYCKFVLQLQAGQCPLQLARHTVAIRFAVL
jgi:hypothetical protein